MKIRSRKPVETQPTQHQVGDDFEVTIDQDLFHEIEEDVSKTDMDYVDIYYFQTGSEDEDIQ